MRDALVRLGRIDEPAARADRPGRLAVRLPQQARVLVHADRRRAGARLPSRRPLGRGAPDRGLPADDRPRQRDPRRRAGVGARGEARRRTTRRPRSGYLRHLVLREGRNTGQVLVQLVTAPGREVRGRATCRGAAPLPGGALDPLGGQRHARRGDQPADACCSGARTRSRRRCSGCASACGRTRSCRRTPRWPRRSTRRRASSPALTGGETVYDLYCGTGTIGLALAAQALTVWGVEISEESVACAIENAELNGIANAAFFAGQRRASRSRSCCERAGPPDVVVVDPPRAGLAGKALRRTGALRRPRIVYVSCNPTTLASDAEGAARRVRLRARAAAVPVDMFPHTPHIESRQPARASAELATRASAARAGRRSAAGSRATTPAARAARRRRTPA